MNSGQAIIANATGMTTSHLEVFGHQTQRHGQWLRQYVADSFIWWKGDLFAYSQRWLEMAKMMEADKT